LTLDEYIYGIAQLVHERGLVFQEVEPAWIRADGQQARIIGSIKISERTYLDISERVRREARRRVTRVRYSYYIVIDGEEFAGFDYDPDHPEPVHHRHTRGHAKAISDKERTLEEIIEMAWKVAEDEDFYAGGELDVDG
jgi:hypothetical protein